MEQLYKHICKKIAVLFKRWGNFGLSKFDFSVYMFILVSHISSIFHPTVLILLHTFILRVCVFELSVRVFFFAVELFIIAANLIMSDSLLSIDRSSPACSFDRLGGTWERNQIALALMVPIPGIQTGRLKVQRNTACLRVLYDFPLPFSWLDQAKPTRPVVCLVSALGTVPRKSSA
jgi:hypothetical protein